MFKMFELDNDVLRVELPEGCTQGELISLCAEELKGIEANCHGLNLRINGRLTTGMALFLGHKLAHVCRSVSIYDPKEMSYFKAVWH